MKRNKTWKTLNCQGEPVARHENSFVLCNDKFYLLAGRGERPVNEFDPHTKTWRSLSAPPFEMHHFQAFVINDLIYVFGAMTGPYPYEPPLENIYLFDPKQDSWAKGPVIPKDRRRGSGGSLYHDGYIYWVGGIKDGHNSGSVNCFDRYHVQSNTWTTLPDAPRVRDHFPIAIANNKLYAIGGRNTAVHTQNNYEAFFAATIQEVDVYDFEKECWFMLEEPLPVGTAAGSIAQINNHLLYIGGESDTLAAHNETQALNLDSHSWSQLEPLVQGRHGTQAITYNNTVYIASGSGNRGGGPELTSIEQFS